MTFSISCTHKSLIKIETRQENIRQENIRQENMREENIFPIIVLGQGKNNTVIQKILTVIKQREKRRIYRRKYRRRKKDLRNLQMVYHHVKPELDDDVTNIISSYL